MKMRSDVGPLSVQRNKNGLLMYDMLQTSDPVAVDLLCFVSRTHPIVRTCRGPVSVGLLIKNA